MAVLVLKCDGVHRVQERPGVVVAALRMDVAVRRSHPFRPDGDRRRLLADDGDVPEVFRNGAVDAVCISTERVVSM